MKNVIQLFNYSIKSISVEITHRLEIHQEAVPREIFSCHSILYPSLSNDLVEEHYLQWGGIARYVLKFATDEEQQARLKEALDFFNIDSVVGGITALGSLIMIPTSSMRCTGELARTKKEENLITVLEKGV